MSSFGHQADEQAEGLHRLKLIDAHGRVYAELMHVDDQDRPTYRMLDSRGGERPRPDEDLGPCDPIDEYEEGEDAWISAELDRAAESVGMVTAEEDALSAELLAWQAEDWASDSSG